MREVGGVEQWDREGPSEECSVLLAKHCQAYVEWREWQAIQER